MNARSQPLSIPGDEPTTAAFGESGRERGRPQRGGRGRPAAFASFGLRVVHPDAAHPLLIRLGAAEATPRTLLAHPAIRAAVEAAAQDPHDSAPTVHATLALAQAALDAGATPREIAAAHPWLGALPLEADDGEPTPARDLTLPGSWAAAHLDALRPASPTLTETHTPEALVAVGVRDTLATLTIRDVVAEPPLTGADTDDAPESHLDGWPEYLDHLAENLGAGTYVGDLPAVADLDAVADDAWPAALAHLAEDPHTRAALLTPVRAGGREAPSYTAWWLRDLLGAPFAAPGATVPFLRPAPPEMGTDDDAARLGPEVLAALGAVGDLATLDLPAWDRYLDGLPPVGTPVPLDDALAIWRGLAALATRLTSANADDGAALDVDRVPVLRARGGSDPVALIAPADDAAVAAEPMWAQVTRRDPRPARRRPRLSRTSSTSRPSPPPRPRERERSTSAEGARSPRRSPCLPWCPWPRRPTGSTRTCASMAPRSTGGSRPTASPTPPPPRASPAPWPRRPTAGTPGRRSRSSSRTPPGRPSSPPSRPGTPRRRHSDLRGCVRGGSCGISRAEGA